MNWNDMLSQGNRRRGAQYFERLEQQERDRRMERADTEAVAGLADTIVALSEEVRALRYQVVAFGKEVAELKRSRSITSGRGGIAI